MNQMREHKKAVRVKSAIVRTRPKRENSVVFCSNNLFPNGSKVPDFMPNPDSGQRNSKVKMMNKKNAF